MPTLTIHLAAALLCFAGQCHPALVGRTGHHTPTGTFVAALRTTDEPGYNGSVLSFDQRDGATYSIHQTWTLRPAERREWRLAHGNTEQRHISMGCVNVPLALFDQLVTRSTVWRVRIQN